MSKNIFVLAEHKQGVVKKVTYELISKASQLVSSFGGEVIGVVVGDELEAELPNLGYYGAQKVYYIHSPLLKNYSTEGYAKVIADFIKEQQPFIFMCGATANGKDLLPRIAAKLDLGMVTDAIDLTLENEKLIIKKPVYSGKAFVKLECESTPKLISVRPNVMSLNQPDTTRTVETIKIEPSINASDVRAQQKEFIASKAGKIELTEAEIIISGGRGMKGPENYEMLEKVASLVGAAVGASRAAVDAGWREQCDQVGQTGKVVTPNLYIACGISGALQHLAGMSSSKCILAINKDPEAPIFKIADYGIVGDIFKVVPELYDELKKIKG